MNQTFQTQLQNAIDLLLKSSAEEIPFSEDVILRVGKATESAGFMSAGAFKELAKTNPISSLLQFVKAAYAVGISSSNKSGEGSPIGSVTPEYVGQFYTDSTGAPDYYTATGITVNDWTKLNGGTTMNYKVYRAILTQSGTDAPVATVLENSLGSVPVWTRGGPGRYSLTLSGGFPVDKTLPFCNFDWARSNPTFVFVFYNDPGVEVRCNNLDLSDVDLGGTAQIEIFVYP